MKISKVEMVENNPQQAQEETIIETIVISDDDEESPDESGRTTADSVDSSYYTDHKSGDDLEANSSLSPKTDSKASALSIVACYDDASNDKNSEISSDDVTVIFTAPAVEQSNINNEYPTELFESHAITFECDSEGNSRVVPAGCSVKEVTNSESFCLDNVGETQVGASIGEVEMSSSLAGSSSGIVPPSDTMSDCMSEKVQKRKENDGVKYRETEKPPLYILETVELLDNGGTLKQPRASSKQDEKNAKGECPPSKRVCFNCEGDNHLVSQCPEQINKALVAKRRVDTRSQTRRYYSPSLDQKYSNFKPGKISDGLKSALGLKKNELPGHIYKMRQHGYPPGYLAETLENLDAVFGPCDANTLRTTMEGSLIWWTQNMLDYPGFTSPVPDEDDPNLGNAINPLYIFQAARRLRDHPGGTSSEVAKAVAALREIDPSTTKKTTQEPPWFEGLLVPSQPGTSSFQKQRSDRAEGNLMPKTTYSTNDLFEMEFQGLGIMGVTNYRMTAELEKQEEERKKKIAMKKKADEELRARQQREHDVRPSSPSLLSPDTPVKFTTTFPSANSPNDIDITDNDANKGSIDSKTCTNANLRKRPLDLEADIITLSSDEEDDPKTTEKKNEPERSPPQKKPKLNGRDEDRVSKKNPNIVPNPVYHKLVEQRLKFSGAAIDGEYLLDLSPPANPVKDTLIQESVQSYGSVAVPKNHDEESDDDIQIID